MSASVSSLLSGNDLDGLYDALCEHNLREFCIAAWPVVEPSTPFIPGWHIDAICDHLQAVTNGEIKRLVINVPFRTAKSTLCSVLWPAWTWISSPNERFLTGSYAEKLAIRDALRTRRLITSPWYQHRWANRFALTGDQNEKKRYENNKTGYRIAFGMTGGVMGEGGDCVAAGTLISTERGRIPVEQLVAMSPVPRVWSVSDNGNMELRRVVASRTIRNRATVTIRTISHVLQCTHDHRIWTTGGYRRATDIGGCSLRVLREERGTDVAWQGDTLRGLRYFDASMRWLRTRVSEAWVRVGQDAAPQPERRADVFARLSWLGAARKGINEAVRQVRQGVLSWFSKDHPQVLFAEVLHDVESGQSHDEATARYSMRDVWENDGNKQHPQVVLLAEVQESGSFNSDAWRRKLTFYRQHVTRWFVWADKADDTSSGWQPVRCVWQSASKTGDGCSPYRRESIEQQPAKSGDTVRLVSPSTAQIETDAQATECVISVEDCGETHDVYDIQVEGNHNFFAGGILVHNCILLDDPHDRQSANSVVELERDLTTFDEAISTRLNNPKTSAIVIIMQRLVENDLSGHVLRQGGWEHLMIPMEYESERHCVTSIGWEDPRKGKPDGELMWPERFPREVVEPLKSQIGSFATAGQLQQRPSPAGGGLFKREWFRYYRETNDCFELLAKDGREVERRVMKADCWTFGASDLALTTKTYNDYSVIGVGSVEGRVENGQEVTSNLFVRDIWRERKEAPYVEDQLRATVARWKLLFIGVEDNSNFDTSVIQRFRRDGLPVKAITPDRDKVTRATTASIWMENGHVWFPIDAPWLSVFESELTGFPTAEHDDQVDVLAYMTIFAADRNLWRPSAPAKPPVGTMGYMMQQQDEKEKRARDRGF